MQKAQAEISASVPNTPAPNGNAAPGDDASTRGLHSARSSAGLTDAPSAAGENGETNEENGEASSAAPDGLPTIRISTESAREEKAALARAEAERKRVAEQSVAQPPPTYEEASKDEGDGDGDGEAKEEKKEKEPFSFSNKRLCERWLDNLFMVLYEVRPRSAHSLRALTDTPLVGFARVDHLPSGDCALQNATRCLSQDRC